MNNVIQVSYFNQVKNVPKNTTILSIYESLEPSLRKTIVGVKIDNEWYPFGSVLKKNTTLNFVTKKDADGYKAYQSGLKMMLVCAFKELFTSTNDLSIDHSIYHGVYARTARPITREDVSFLKNKMNYYVQANLPFKKLTVDVSDANRFYQAIHHDAAAQNLLNISNSVVSFYQFQKTIQYFYTYMPYSTECLDDYDLVYVSSREIALMYSTSNAMLPCAPYLHYKSVIESFRKQYAWLNAQGVPYVYQLNQQVVDGTMPDFIQLCETNYDLEIMNIGSQIISSESRYVLLGGPSSSGKTTTTKKLALFLKSQGYEVLLISVDDYFKDREDSPKHEDGSYDFECLEALDLDLLNTHLKKLTSGEEVELPTYNFVEGKKEFKGNIHKLSDKGIVLMEGLHSLNPKMTFGLDENLIYRIYLSPFMSVKLDQMNYISTTDLRLLRRICRDNRSRGANALDSLESWDSVRHGEDQYIFPYLNHANAILNTSFPYELGVLKVFVEPLLYSVPSTSPYFEEARRLINFLKSYFTISGEYVPEDSILREFIGGSSFESEDL